jgi:Ca2+/Na+ antiporter
MTVAGDDDENEPAAIDYFLHFLAIFWKVLFALVPPPSLGGGWPCFFIALVFIGGLTAVIGDVAAVFGCTLGMSDMLTGITFVALGTSLPDTFASKQAAEGSPNADAAIGNITGSNAVNVFLGLGLPWVIATAWYESQPEGQRTFVVPEGSLKTSVIVFSSFASLCIFVLFLRRILFGGELGGPTGVKFGTSALFVSLWIAYVYLSATLSL